MLDARVAKIQDGLLDLEATKDIASAKTVILSILELLLPQLSTDSNEVFRIYNDKDGKLKANSGWFQSDDVIADRLAVYSVDLPPESNLDVKLFAVNKANKATISWAVGLTPNFEDEPFNGRYNVGIDFVIPKSRDRVILTLSKNYLIRTIELRGSLTVTYLEILNSWATIDVNSPKAELHSTLWSTLDVSPLNKQFYEGVSSRFINLRQYLVSNGIHDSTHSAQFANRLIGRIIFSWFLDKKGLINKDEKYFEPELFQEDHVYYSEKLETLFYKTLNIPVKERKHSDQKTPYLNGGLFEAKPEDFPGISRLKFPNGFFQDFFEFISGYNFTTDESTSEFQQVAIDPEMLGRIFENLLAEVSTETGEQARKARGAFYTPREVVDYICRETLRSYLGQLLDAEPDINRRLYQLIDASEREFQDQDHNWRRDLKIIRPSLTPLLDNLRVFDPACGSGAFPMGMMQLLLKVYSRLDARFNSHKTKLGIIERNIFGSDIEPMAVEISRLRAWLALIVDEDQDSTRISPLPNLDFKFVCANSLVTLDNSGQFVLFEDSDLDMKLKTILTDYFSTSSFEKKKALRAKYHKLINEEETLFGESLKTTQIKSFRPFESDSVATFFDPIHMFGLDKFDLVIGNPPYIGLKGHASIFEPVRKSTLGKRFFSGKMDYFYFFFHLGLDLLSEGGVMGYVTTNYFLTATYSKKLVDDLQDRATILKLINFNEVRLFDSAIGQHNLISIVQKDGAGGPAETAMAGRELRGKISDADLNDFLTGRHQHGVYSKIPQKDLFKNSQIILSSPGSGGISAALERMEGSALRLSDLCAVNQGIVSGGDKVSQSHIDRYTVSRELLGKGIFVLTESELDELGLSENELELVKPFFKNSDISQYSTNLTPSLYIIYASKNMGSVENYPNIIRHLDQFKSIFESAAGSNFPYLTRPRSIDFEGPKIVVPQRSKRNVFGFNDIAWYSSADVYFITLKQKNINLFTLLGIFNSKAYFLWLYERGKRKGEALELYQEPLANLPIPELAGLNTGVASRIAELAESQTGHKQLDRNVLQEIDDLTCQLFGFTEDERQAIETWKPHV